MKKLVYLLVFSLLSLTAYSGTTESMGEDDITVYYVYNQKSVKISIPTEDEDLRLSVYNILGTRVIYTTLPYTNSSLDVSDLKEGQYFLKIADKKGSTLKMIRFVVY